MFDGPEYQIFFSVIGGLIVSAIILGITLWWNKVVRPQFNKDRIEEHLKLILYGYDSGNDPLQLTFKFDELYRIVRYVGLPLKPEKRMDFLDNLEVLKEYIDNEGPVDTQVNYLLKILKK